MVILLTSKAQSFTSRLTGILFEQGLLLEPHGAFSHHTSSLILEHILYPFNFYLFSFKLL